MSQTNYLRVLKSCICTECNFDGYDSEFENFVNGEVKRGVPPSLDSESNIESIMTNSIGEYQIVYKDMICPKCNEKNKIKYD